MAAGADEATRRPWGSPPLRTSPRGMPRGRLPRTSLPGGRGSGGPPRRTRPRDGGGVTSPPWMRPRGRRTVTDKATVKRRSVGGRFRRSHRTAAVVIASAEKSVRMAVGDFVADEAVGRRGSGTGDRRRKRGHRTTAGCVASVDKASSAEGRGVGTCHRDSQGRLWASRCGRDLEGGSGEPGLPPRMRPHYGHCSRFARWMWPRRKAARMLLWILLRPDGFRGCFLRIRLCGGG